LRITSLILLKEKLGCGLDIPQKNRVKLCGCLNKISFRQYA
jgi:hypothetical protein